MKRDDLYEKAFQAVVEAFRRKTDRLAEVAMPVIKQVYENQGQMYENILVPITDGKLVYNIRTNLEKAYTSESKEVVTTLKRPSCFTTSTMHGKKTSANSMNSRSLFRTLRTNKKTRFSYLNSKAYSCSTRW